MPFAILIVTLVQTADEDHHISLLGFFKSLRLQFCRRACLVKRTSNGNTIETLNRVTDIAAGVIEPHPLPLSKGRGEFRVDTIQWQDLVLHFQRGGAATHRHHLDGILTNYQNTSRLTRVYGQ